MAGRDLLDVSRLARDVKDRVAIEDVIARSVVVLRAGRSMKALCPFHDEKTPSFVISPLKQSFRCFGCGERGDVIEFVQKRDRCDFIDALRSLARHAGIDEEGYSNGVNAISAPKERSVLHAIAAKYSQWLELNDSARAYLHRRDFDESTLILWMVGYAAKGWAPLLGTRIWTVEQLKDVGLLSETDGRRYELFRDRIIFPILGKDGQVIGFGGRVLDDSKPKYINSPDSQSYRKSHTLYGAHLRPTWRDKAIHVVEGYFDVWRLVQHEFACVGACGTAFTVGHLRQLLRSGNDIVFAFDGDEAGIKAADNVTTLLSKYLPGDVMARIAILPDGEDPDSFVRVYGPHAYSALTDAAPTWVDFAFARIEGEFSHESQLALLVTGWEEFCGSIVDTAWNFAALHRGRLSLGIPIGDASLRRSSQVGFQPSAMPSQAESVALNLIVNYLPVFPKATRADVRKRFEGVGSEVCRRLAAICDFAGDDDRVRREIGQEMYGELVANPIPLTSQEDFLCLIGESANSLIFQSLLQ